MATTTDSSPVLELTLTIPASADKEKVSLAISKLIVAMDNYHRSLGGSGLKIVPRLVCLPRAVEEQEET